MPTNTCPGYWPSVSDPAAGGAVVRDGQDFPAEDGARRGVIRDLTTYRQPRAALLPARATRTVGH